MSTERIVRYLVVGLYVGFSAVLFQTVQLAQPGPYMDEIFHVPQTQKFCNGTFDEWDPKITTLPGTYLMAAGILTTFGTSLASCYTLALRSYNFVLGMVNAILIYSSLKHYMVGESKPKRLLAALNISMFPVLYFFNFLFYTDVTSTFWLLAMHLLFLRRWLITSGLICGAAAVLTRQTNVVWVGWYFLIMTWEVTKKEVPVMQKAYNGILMARNKDNRRQRRTSDSTTVRQVFQYMAHPKIIKLYAQIMIKYLWDYLGYNLVLLGFCLFVQWNKGIVVGDKSAHQITLNIPQLGYFAVVYGFFCWPFVVRRLRTTLRFMNSYKILIFLVLAFSFFAVYFNTVAHPYLLSDNRHYPFYVWNRVYQSSSWFKFLLIPLYVSVWCFVLSANEAYSHSNFFIFICCLLQFVPQLLLEFRYFIPAYLFSRFTFRNVTWLELMAEFVLMLTVNIFTVYMFVYKPFHWPGIDAEQRFMW